MSHTMLSAFVEATAARFGIPGVAVGVWADGREVYACHGVTSVDNPLPVDEHILTSGAFTGQRGFFTRDESGAVVGVDIAGRLFSRVPADILVDGDVSLPGRTLPRCAAVSQPLTLASDSGSSTRHISREGP